MGTIDVFFGLISGRTFILFYFTLLYYFILYLFSFLVFSRAVTAWILFISPMPSARWAYSGGFLRFLHNLTINSSIICFSFSHLPVFLCLSGGIGCAALFICRLMRSCFSGVIFPFLAAHTFISSNIVLSIRHVVLSFYFIHFVSTRLIHLCLLSVWPTFYVTLGWDTPIEAQEKP